MKGLKQYCKKFFKDYYGTDCLTDKKCLDAALSRFLDSGKKEDAFDVYFCFAEIFKVFGNGYNENTKRLLEIICEYEMNAGALVEKQRDHYSHSVFVFAIGLSIYTQSPKYRAYFEEKTPAAETDKEFLYRWGLTALFHDIGYPFEIVFEQIKAYTKSINADGGHYPVLTYKSLENFIRAGNADIHGELTAEICKKLGLDYDTVLRELNALVAESDEYMDHGYFGAVMMYKNLIDHNERGVVLDVAASIMLHNSFLIWKLKKHFTKKLCPAEYPLAFLLMFCDDLQDYAREGFGKVNKNDNLAYTAEFDIDGGAFKIVYVFDETGSGTAEERVNAKIAKMDFYGTEKLFNSTEISYVIRKSPKPQAIYMSANFFKNIQRIAMQIHAFYLTDKRADILLKTWDCLTLEYKLSNIAQAKSYSEKLNKFGFFYDDRNLHYDTVSKFNKKQTEILAVCEHKRWLDEKLSMGWRHGVPKDKAEREQKRIHPDLIPYEALDENAKDKDRDAVSHIIENLNLAGFKVYKFK